MEKKANICRLCLLLQDKDNDTQFTTLTPSQKQMFEEVTATELSLDSQLPVQICSTCAENLEKTHKFRQQLIQAQKILTQVQNESKQEVPFEYEDIEYLEEESDEPLTCSICSKNLNSRRDLNSHMRSHNQEKRFKCKHENCQKAFRYQHHLVNHERTHTQSSPFQCEECGAAFRQKYPLTVHKRKHSKSFLECKNCKSQFVMKSQLIKHETMKCDGIYRPYVVKPRFNEKKINTKT